jgi:hypothetical protein
VSGPVELHPCFSVTAEAIRARVDAAQRLMEIAKARQDAETIRCAAAIALADMAARGDDIELVTKEYAKTLAALVYADGAYHQAMDDLANFRDTVPLSA